jgi:hypothetical protein
MPPATCPSCGARVEAPTEDELACAECGYHGPAQAADASVPDRWDLSVGFDLDEEARAWTERAGRNAARLLAVAAFTVGVGLVLMGAGNGVIRITELGGPDGAGDVVGFVLHLAAAAVLVVLGATLLPLGLRFLGGDERASVEQPALLFSVLWLVLGFVAMLAGAPNRGGAIGGGLVLVLAGLFGVIAVSSYDPRRRGSAITAGVLGLVGGGLLVGGTASVPAPIAGGGAYGASLVFRYGSGVHGSGLLVAVLAAAVYPFVGASRRGRAGVLLAVSLGGLVWGIGELVATVSWLATAPWETLGRLGAGASAGFGLVAAGGAATLLGGLAVFAASILGVGAAGLPLATVVGPDRAPGSGREGTASTAGAADGTCPSCGATGIATPGECPACGYAAPNGCPDCGAELDPTAAYCPGCGAEVAAS